MYLKSLEIIGFKSFADKTRLEFGPGISAIVGPNGCGKSNISDAIRWVLGEQSARILRGTKMEDCIFNGTDSRKPMGMAEVSLTLADCESTLATEFHEVTVTRRVFRSGEGQYFINKTPCRLKDIQRLFMDTGIGTNSYSLMEQGRIDLILRSKPEDRREVFEEASGITKYKADKREAMRKLEQTELNLTRLADIIKEVKRQIISLQRQAGKAARYKKLQDEIRKLDVFVSREKLQGMDRDLLSMETEINTLNSAIERLQNEVQQREESGTSLRDFLAESEKDIAIIRQTEAELRERQQRSQQTIEMNDRRVQDLQNLYRRDTEEVETNADDLEKHHAQLAKSKEQLSKAQQTLATAEEEVRVKARKNSEHEQLMDACRKQIQQLHQESMELEERITRIQNDLHRMENEDRNVVAQRERRAAEQANLQVILKSHEKNMASMTESLKQLKIEAEQAQVQLNRCLTEQTQLTETTRAAERQISDALSQSAATQAQIDLLTRNLSDKNDFSDGAKQLLDKNNPLKIDQSRLMGALAEQIEADPDYRIALETIMRSSLDALIVADRESALAYIEKLAGSAKGGAVRLMVADFSTLTDTAANNGIQAEVLATHVKCADDLQPLVQRLLANVWVVESLGTLPASLPSNGIFVTRQGAVLRGNGSMELYRQGAQTRSPLVQKHLLTDLKDAHITLQTTIKTLRAEIDQKTAAQQKLSASIAESRSIVDETRSALARHEGELQMVSRQFEHSRDNLETVTSELHELEKQGSSVEARSTLIQDMEKIRARRTEIKVISEARVKELATVEATHREIMQDLSDARVQFAQHKQTVEHVMAQHQPLTDRIKQLESQINDRETRLRSYQSDIENLQKGVLQARTALPSLQEELQRNSERLKEITEQRDRKQHEWRSLDDQLKQIRTELENNRTLKNTQHVRLTELRMSRQYLVERITTDYHISADAIQIEAAPEWPEEGQPPMDILETQIAEIRAKIEAMGPVNTAAIEEYEELQKRFDFLTQQQTDLVNSKTQLMDMIRKINQTTTEMFAKAFDAININFQHMFTSLFGGGTAKLILTDEGDVLESGIEIYARPPGKRLQSISLMSGGESTMTAVALLFSIYMVKPSPFCLLDEMDAALDESNIHRFVKVLMGFLTQSQFVVITHNRQTISAANLIYGVTMQADKCSRIVSMKFKDSKEIPFPEKGKLAERTAEIHTETDPNASVAPQPKAATTQETTDESSAEAAEPVGATVSSDATTEADPESQPPA